jgi:MFS family permease
VAAILPVLVGVWQEQAGLHVDQAGLVAATELFAQVAGTGLFLWASRRWASRRMAVVGLAVMVIGNIATAVSADFASLLLARAIGGAGGGLIRALCMMYLAKALSPGRAFAVYAGAQVGLAAATTALVPHFIDSQGVESPFLVLTLACVFGFALCPLLPRHSPLAPSAIRRRGLASYPLAAILAIMALFIFFAGQGALWTYLAPIGASRSIPAAGITQALTLLNFAGLAGALGVGAMAHRVNPRIALLTLLAGACRGRGPRQCGLADARIGICRLALRGGQRGRHHPLYIVGDAVEAAVVGAAARRSGCCRLGGMTCLAQALSTRKFSTVPDPATWTNPSWSSTTIASWRWSASWILPSRGT